MEHLEFFYADGLNKLFPEQSLVITPLPIDYIFSNFAANQEVNACAQDIKNRFNQKPGGIQKNVRIQIHRYNFIKKLIQCSFTLL